MLNTDDLRAYTAPQMLIGGHWRLGSASTASPVIDPATGNTLDELSHASSADLDAALVAAERGFAAWKRVPAAERQRMLQHGIDAIRARREDIARCLTLEQGKPLVQARAEVDVATSMMQWCWRSLKTDPLTGAAIAQ
ncbi:aldehyde dehydrogenase family protein, partial [Pseudorhodoferax aquiterrae]|uniref:aldehyde dehydrogenase family protein n=1 Tax=Pseudorhodoferax aquiterrae TaxID=747304 RepID=UPI00167B3BF0